MNGKDVLKSIEKEKLIVIFRGIPTEGAANVAKALADGGVKFIEITYNHRKDSPEKYFEEQMLAVKAAVGDRVCMGAGTVLTVGQVELAHRLGAGYIVSPNTNEAVIKRTKELDMVSIPGAMTPTEIVYARDCGADIVKLYIVDDVNDVKYLMGPLGHIPMQATCNVSLDTIPQFLQAGIKAFGTRAFLTNDLIENKDYQEIENRARKHVEMIKMNS
ncbi:MULTISPECIES: bifunctional 4-hydroxy-2-oxoglutarate aldolase/2-dehydro-3-deoxy-phosphogluconate aldolase [unclassified Clostridium]|uniref:bifunctional 4-hydroxy-2-oxoglutarate aldolase/2-dehydro-3-deoxy-phosphogluconate aldolase n=1 Tax=unclassified Clostridium TaxID=2614128 RepID=UPI00110685CD|nr:MULTISPECIES: bifunctional 4-hydroxy-2-oxoglutarate aldolase/2-dehydro-3-deoxy-phosphogluconate aldolase [unclassified Clostridium]